MALFPTTTGRTQKAASASAHNTATGYPTSESVGPRQTQSNKRSSYPPPHTPQVSLARDNDPPQASSDASNALPPRRPAPPPPGPNEEPMEVPAGFQFAPRIKGEERVEGRSQRGRSTQSHGERRQGGSRVISTKETTVDGTAEQSTREPPKMGPSVRQRGASMGPSEVQAVDEIEEIVEERPQGQRPQRPQVIRGDTDQQRAIRDNYGPATDQDGDRPTHSRGRIATVPPPSVGPSQDGETDSEQRHSQNVNRRPQTLSGHPSFSTRPRNRSTTNLPSQSGPGFGADTVRTSAKLRQRGQIPSESRPPNHGNVQYPGYRHRDGAQSVSSREKEGSNEKTFEDTDRDEPIPLNATSAPKARGRSTVPVSHPPGTMPGGHSHFHVSNRGDRNSTSRSHAPSPGAVGPILNSSSTHSSHNLYREAAGGQRAREHYVGENVVVAVPSESPIPGNIVRSKSAAPAGTGPTEALFRQLVTTMNMENSDRREEKTKLASAIERIYELQDQLSESHAHIIAEKEKNEEINQIYNSDVDTLKEQLSDQTKKSLILSRSAEGMLSLQDGRIARLQSLNEDYVIQMVTMRSETEILAKRLVAFEESMIKQREAVKAAKDLVNANEKLQKELSDIKGKRDTLDEEIAGLTQAKHRASEEQQATKERSDKDAVACWDALTGKLPSDRIDSLKLNKASPLEEIINLLNSTHFRHVKDAKSLATTQNDLKTLKASYQAGCDAVVELCKVIHVEAPDQSTPSFLKEALHTSKAVIEERQLELKETTRRFENAVKEKTELIRQLKELTNAKSLAEAERDDLRLSVGKTQEELAASSDKAKTIVTLQKELKGSAEKVDDYKKKLSASKEEEQKLRTQLVVARGEKEQVLKAKQDELEAIVKQKTETIADKDKQIANLTSQAEKNQEIAKSEKIHGIGVSAAAANAEAAERLKKELEVERARHLEDEVLERYKADKSTPAERALIEKVRGQTTSPAEVVKDAEKIAEVIWKERVAKAENEVNKLKKTSKKWEDKYTDLHATLASKVVESEGGKGKESRQAKTNLRSKSVTGSNPLGPAHMKKDLPVPDSLNNSDEEDEVQEARSKKQPAIITKPSSPAKGKKKTETRAQVNTDFSKASEHPEVQDKLGKRPASPEGNGAGMSAYKKTRFGELPQSSDPPPAPYSDNDELLDDDDTLVPTQTPLLSEDDHEYTPATQTQTQIKSKASSSNLQTKRGKSMASIDAEEDEDQEEGTSRKPGHSQVKKIGSSNARQKTSAPKRKLQA